jgi:hypothetical protein
MMMHELANPKVQLGVFYALTKLLLSHIKGIIHLMGFRQWHFDTTKAGHIFHYVPEQGSSHISHNTLQACTCQAFAASFSSPAESTLLHTSFLCANHQT